MRDRPAQATATLDSRDQTAGATPEALSAGGILLLIALTIFWGLNWPMMKMALAEVPPWTFRSLCLMIGGSTLLLLTRLGGRTALVAVDRLPRLGLVALFNVTGWHLLSAYALLHIGGGRAAIIGYTMPLWASLISVLVLRVRLTAPQILALALGMAALVLLIGGDLRALGTAPIGPLLMLAAALCWAIGTVLVKTFDWAGMPVTALTGWQQLLGGVPIVIGWWLLEPWPDLMALGLPSAIGLFYAVFVAMVFCHTAYFKLVSLLPAHVAAISTLAVPVVGVVSSAWLLAEPVGPAEIGALVLVMSALILLIRASRAG